MNLPLTQREQIRLLKPSRPKAPTEYNLQYKRWPPRPFTYDSFRIVNSSDRKKTPSLKSDLESACETRFTSSTGYPASSITRTQDQASHSVNTVQSASESEPDVLSKEWFKDYELTSALRAKTAVLHDRPVRQKPVRSNSAKNSGPAKCGQLASTSQEELSKKGQLMETEFSVKLRHLNNSLGKDKQHSVQPSHYREAWTNEDHTTKQQKTSGHKPKQRVRSDPLKMRDLCAVIDHIDGGDWSSDLPADSGCFETLPSEKSIANIRSDSVIDVKPFDMEKQATSKSSTKPINKDLPRENRRKKSSMLEGIDEASLRKIYGDLSSDDIKRLQRSYKGVVDLKKSNGKRPSAADDEKTFQQYMMRKSNCPFTIRTKKNWNTSYDLNYRNWDFPSNDENLNVLYQARKSLVDSDKQKSDPHQLSDKDEQIEESDKEDGESLWKPEPDETDLHDNVESMTDVIRDRMIKEAERVEEQEYRSLFREDGKPKMTTTTSSGVFKDWKEKKEAPPIWANKTVVSLGSAHWNLPLNKNEDWDSKREKNHRKNEKTISQSKHAYKIRVFDPTEDKQRHQNSKMSNEVIVTDLEDGDKLKQDVAAVSSDPFIALYYPDRRTNYNYLTEYMRKYHRFPVQQNRVRV